MLAGVHEHVAGRPEAAAAARRSPAPSSRSSAARRRRRRSASAIRHYPVRLLDATRMTVGTESFLHRHFGPQGRLHPVAAPCTPPSSHRSSGSRGCSMRSSRLPRQGTAASRADGAGQDVRETTDSSQAPGERQRLYRASGWSSWTTAGSRTARGGKDDHDAVRQRHLRRPQRGP